MKKAIFFDRDGTLNVEVGYLYKIEDFKWIDGAVDAIKFCNQNNYLAIVVTNQSGIARGFYSAADVDRLHSWINEELSKIGAHIDAFYYCPHHPRGAVEKYSVECECRKPRPKMILDAIKHFDIDRAQSLMIGDTQRDVEAGANAGVRSILFNGGNLLETLKAALENR